MSTTSESEDWSSDDDSPLSSSYDFNPFSSRVRVSGSPFPSPTPRRRPTAQSSTTASIEGIVPFRYLPSPAERDAVLQKIQEREENDKNLSDQIEAAEEALLCAKEARLENIRQIGALKWSISALARIPDEVFGIIFEICVFELGLSPWSLTKVSSNFRRSAFATRKIWTRIRLERENSNPSLRARNIGGRERCLNLAQLQSALDRSGKAPLDIEIRHCTVEMAHYLANERGRWEFVKMHRLSRRNRANIMPILFGATEKGGRLQSATLTVLSDRDLRKWLTLSKPPALELSYCGMKSIAKVSWWSELRRLCLKHLECGDIALGNSIAYSMFSSVSRYITYLEIIDLDGGRFRLQNFVHFPELVEAKLVGIDYWWQFKGDKLLKIRLKPNGPPPTGTLVSYPSLLELDYNAYPLSMEPGLITAPNLQLLTLQNARSDTSLVWMDNSGTRSTLTPKRLCLQSYTASFKPLLDSLRPYTELEELRLEHCNLHLSFFKALSVRPSKKYPMLCPGLRQLDVVLSYSSGRADKERYSEVFEAIVNMRKRYGQPLSKLLVSWPSLERDNPVQDFVTVE